MGPRWARGRPLFSSRTGCGISICGGGWAFWVASWEGLPAPMGFFFVLGGWLPRSFLVFFFFSDVPVFVPPREFFGKCIPNYTRRHVFWQGIVVTGNRLVGKMFVGAVLVVFGPEEMPLDVNVNSRRG